MAVDDVIKAARNMARTTSQVLDNSKTATKALNKIVSEHGTALNNARKIVGSNTATKALNEIVSDHGTALNNARKIANANTTTKSINNIVAEHGTALNNAKKVANANTSVPSRYDARGNYQQALEKAKEIAGGNTTNKAINNLNNTTQRTVPPFLDPWDLSWNEWTEVGNKKLTMYMDDAPYSERVINEINNGRTSTGPKYGPRKDSIPNDDGPWQNNFDFSDDGPKTNSSGGNSGGGNNNKNTNTNSGPEGGPNGNGGNKGPNNSGGNEGPNERRSWKDYANDYFGGIGDTYKGVRDGGNFWDALESAHKNDDGSLRWSRVAGTYAAAAVGSRVISGGGLYKDRYGNSNIPGVPFI